MEPLFFDTQPVSPFTTFTWKHNPVEGVYYLSHGTHTYPLITIFLKSGEVVLSYGVLRCLVAHTRQEYCFQDENFERMFGQTGRLGVTYLRNAMDRLIETKAIIMRDVNVSAEVAEEYMMFGAHKGIPMHYLTQYSPHAMRFLMTQPYDSIMNFRARAVSPLADDEEEFKFLFENLSDEVIESFLL